MRVVHVTEESFAACSREGVTAVVKFSSVACPPCRAFAAVFAEVAEQHPTHVFADVDVDAVPSLAEEFDVEAVPTLVVIRDGVVVFRKIGVLPASDLAALIAAVAELDMDELRRQCGWSGG